MKGLKLKTKKKERKTGNERNVITTKVVVIMARFSKGITLKFENRTRTSLPLANSIRDYPVKIDKET